MHVAGVDRVPASAQSGFHRGPPGFGFLQHHLAVSVAADPLLGQPERLMDEDQGPTHLGVFPQFLFRPRDLFLSEEGARARAVLGVQAEKEHVLVDERIVTHAEELVPDPVHHVIAHVMISRQIEKGHLEALDEAVEFSPLPTDLLFIFLAGPAGNQITDGDHKLGLHLIDLGHRAREHTGPQPPGPIRHDRELKVIRVVSKGPLGPGLLRRGDTVGKVLVGLGTRLRAKRRRQTNDREEQGEQWFHERTGRIQS